MNKLTQKRWVNTTDLNSKGILFGGRLLAWVDEDASLLVADSIDQEFVTGRVFNSEFIAPVKAGQRLTFCYYLAHRSNATITVVAEVFDELEQRVFSSYVTFVGIKDGKPVEITCRYDISKETIDWHFVEDYRKFLKERKHG